MQFVMWKAGNEPECVAKAKHVAIIMNDTTHFLSLNKKLNVRQTMVNTMPIVDSRMKITVRERSTVSIISIGFPSYGIPPITKSLTSVD
jgi:hypothetical protein